MKDKKQFKKNIKEVFDGLDGAALISFNQDGSMNVMKDEKTNYSFLIYDKEGKFNEILNRFYCLGYSINLNTYRGLGRPQDLIKVDVDNKKIVRPMIVSPNHYKYLVNDESILIENAISNFDELVIECNKQLANSLCQYKQRRNNGK